MADKRVDDLEEVLQKVRAEKEAIEKGKNESDLEVKRQKEELSVQIAKLNFTKIEHDNREGVLQDKLRMSVDDVSMLRKQLEEVNGVRDTMERNGRELKDQLSKLTIELAASKDREADGKTEKELLQSRVVDLENLSVDHKAEITKLSSQLQDINDAKTNSLQGLSMLDHERRKDLEEIARLSKQLQEANNALTSEEQRKNDLTVQLRTATDEIITITRKANDAKSAGEDLVLQLENKIKTLTDALASKDHDLSHTSQSKDTADKV